MKEPSGKILPLAAIFTSLVALAAVFINRPSASTDAGQGEQLAELVTRMERLESRMAAAARAMELQGSDGAWSDLSGEVPDAGGSGDLAGLEARQTRLEEQLKKYGIIERFEAHERHVDESYLAALNADLPAKQRFEALKLLNEEGRVDQAVVNSMMDLWDRSSEDPKLGPYHRWMLMENLRGHNDPRFRDNILSMLREQPGAKMTGQALATLEPMLPDPAVEEWLTHLSANDAEPKIREYAAGILENAGGGNK